MDEPPGLFCRDLAALGWSFLDALAYWEREGQPARMDADLNGIPCETVYSAAEVASSGYAPATTESSAPPPSTPPPPPPPPRRGGLDGTSCPSVDFPVGSIYLTDFELSSDYTIHETDFELGADATVRLTSSTFSSGPCTWYITDFELSADYTVYMTDFELSADYSVFFTR